MNLKEIRIKVIFFLFILFSIYNYGQENKCKDMKNGTFKYTLNDYKVKITRNDDLQIEKDLETGMEIHTLVEWTSDCEYTLTYSKVVNTSYDFSDYLGKKIYAKIISIDGNIIKVDTRSGNRSSVLEFIKIEDE
ncbi:hypothetical protein [Aureivirga sp. CE67]|uniref:hypothetical protein n=1 Tax=Aureivirga sp. CE67 TaxID=1788983 RepID=UPI0018C8E94E|nr:hypothetical protein [Aureivirga sp. CE67]